MNKTSISIIAVISVLIMASSPSSVFGYGSAPVQSSSGNYTVEVHFDKESYVIGETIAISGNVNKYDEDRALQVTIFDSERNMISNEKFTVNPDTSFSFEIIPDKEFVEGQYDIRVQYGTSKVTVEKAYFVIEAGGSAEVSAEQKTAGGPHNIPDWIRNNAAWWAEGSIDDNSFVQGIQFMIKEDIMRIPATEQGTSSSSSAQGNNIPDWIRNNAAWWAEGSIDDNSFVQGIQFMIKEGLMRIS